MLVIVFIFILLNFANSLAQESELQGFVVECYENGAPKIVMYYQDNDQLNEIIAIRCFLPDSLLSSVEFPQYGYLEKCAYYGERMTWGFIPPEKLELLLLYEMPETNEKSFEIFFNGTRKAFGAGAPYKLIRLNSFGIEGENLTFDEYEVIRQYKSLSYQLPECENICFKHLTTDFRKANDVSFLKYQIAGDFNLDDYPLSENCPDNVENQSSVEKGINLDIPQSWDGFINPDDTTWIDPDSPYWEMRPSWWKPAFSATASQENSLIWSNDGNPWIQGEYIYFEEESGMVYWWYWKKKL